MGTLSARTLRDSLQKAKGVGLVEERFTIGDCDVVVRSLRPDEYEALITDCKGLEDVTYLNTFQMGHVNRALVELNGVSFRDVQFVDDEEPDPKKPGQMKPVKLELHRWLEKNVLNSWGKEALYVAYRKVADAVEKAETQSQEGIQFLTAEETPEEHFRRLVGEMVALQEDVPTLIVERVLDENGLMLKTTAEEVKRAMEAAGNLAWEEIQKQKAEAAAAQVVETAPPPVEAPAPAPLVESPSPADLMRRRQPLNTGRVEAPPTQAQPVLPASRQPPAPPPEATPVGAIQGPPLTGSAATRSAQMAALEAEADMVGALSDGPPEGFDPSLRPQIIPILERRQEPGDPNAAAKIIDQPPRVGLNPHYRPQRRF